MSRPESASVLVVDDDAAVLRSMSGVLGLHWDVHTAESGEDALSLFEEGLRPDVVLLDIRMPGMDGYEVCERMQGAEELAWIPVIFVTVLDSERDRRRALAAGGAAYLQKPFEASVLIETVREHLGTRVRWQELREVEPAKEKAGDSAPDWMSPSAFVEFREYLIEQRKPTEEQVSAMRDLAPTELYELGRVLHLPEEQIGRYVARFLDVPFQDRILAEEAALGALPRTFCRSRVVLPMGDGSVVVANPFDWELMDSLRHALWSRAGSKPGIRVADPGRIRDVLDGGRKVDVGPAMGEARVITLAQDAEDPRVSGLDVANEILRGAISEGASDVHLEPAGGEARVRFRIDGDMHDIRTIEAEAAARVISRLKAVAGMNIAERRKPQDGAVRATLGDRSFKLRLATSSTSGGETLVIRVLEPDVDPMPLESLGMTGVQADTLRDSANRHQGMILVVGPTGSGKSTTIFTLLSNVDGVSRSIMSVEDPVEYDIPHANQQQVNDRAGVTFQALLRSAMRQDPDILFLGEVRDPFSARAALDFASSGHLTISTLHASSSTSALFRLERLDVDRGAMADALSVVVAQKLLKKLCPECKSVAPPEPEEIEALSPFTEELPDRVARPVGCPACRETGYQGRQGVYEILVFDAEIARLVREGTAVADIRQFCLDRGDYMMADHAVASVRRLLLPVKDAQENVFLEERRARSVPLPSTGGPDVSVAEVSEPTAEAPGDRARDGTDGEEEPTVLVVDDDGDMRALLELYLKGAGYRPVPAADGVEALLALGSQDIDVVISDINMPNLDGERLLEMMVQKGVDVPVIFLTGTEDEEVEVRLLEHGAADFLRKPVKKDVLLIRLSRAVGRR